MIEIVPVEPRAVVEADRDGALDRRFRSDAEERIDDERKRHDREPKRVNAAQIRRERGVIGYEKPRRRVRK